MQIQVFSRIVESRLSCLEVYSAEWCKVVLTNAAKTE